MRIPHARRYCLHARAFQADRTAIFDRIVSVIGQQVRLLSASRLRRVPLASFPSAFHLSTVSSCQPLSLVLLCLVCAQVERGQEDNNCLAYWLSNTVTLLHMLNKNIKPASGGVKAGRPGGVTAAGVGAATRSVLGAMFGSRSGASPSSLAHAEASIHGGGVGEAPARPRAARGLCSAFAASLVLSRVGLGPSRCAC